MRKIKDNYFALIIVISLSVGNYFSIRSDATTGGIGDIALALLAGSMLAIFIAIPVSIVIVLVWCALGWMDEVDTQKER